MQVLFLCPHAAAKSVLAVALAIEAARVRSLDVTFINAGTDPDDSVSPFAMAAIERLGLSYSGRPRLVTALDIDLSDVVVSLGCSPDELPSQPDRWIDWRGLPDASQDVDGLIRALRPRLEELLDGDQ